MEFATTRVVRLQELLDIVFSFVDKTQLLNCALVSKTWTEPALNNLWAEVDDILHLFRILGPIKPVSTSQNTIIRILD